MEEILNGKPHFLGSDTGLGITKQLQYQNFILKLKVTAGFYLW